MEDLKQSMLAYAENLAEELQSRAESIRQETERFNEYLEGRYAGRFEGVAGKLDAAAAKAEAIIARLDADAAREEARSRIRDTVRNQVRGGLAGEEPASEATEEEKLHILQMLEQGILSIEQAEELISAL